MPYARSRHHNGHLRLRRRHRLRNYRKDFDQIDNDLKEESDKLLNQEVDLDKPGFAQHYCLHCAKYFISQRALDDHFKTKVHKRRMKALMDDPYTQEEAERAAGHGSFDKLPAKRKMETQPSKEEYNNEGKRVKVDYFTQEELDKMKSKKRKSLNSSKVVDDEEMKE